MTTDEFSPAGSVPAGTLPVGAETMSPAMQEMQFYCQYLYRLIEPALGERVWELGVGYGNYTHLLRQAGKIVLAADIDEECLIAAKGRFQADRDVVTARVDLADEASVRNQSWFRADSVVCLNVLEHIQDDLSALKWVGESVEPAARLGLIVPALPRLYGRMDAEAGHQRRYTLSGLRHLFQRAGWTVIQLRYVNLLGALGWWYHNRVRRTAGLRDRAVNRQMRAADSWLPRIARLTDPVFARLGGLSVLGIASFHGQRCERSDACLVPRSGESG